MRQQLAVYALVLSALCCAAVYVLLRLHVLEWNPTGSRYVSWLPSFSVEVTRVRPEAALAGAQLDAAAAQLQLMFPQYSRAALATDLARTRSADLTLDNILEGRLPELADMVPPEPVIPSVAGPETTPAPAAEPAAAPAPVPGGVPAAVRVDVATATASSAGPFAAGSSSPPEPEAAPGVRFSGTAEEREALLARRKEALLSAARRRYLERLASLPPATSPAAPAPQAPPPC